MSPDRPLSRLRILLTHPEGKRDGLESRLESLGAHVVVEPLIRTVPLSNPDYGRLDAGIRRLESYDWLLFTSAEGVRYCVRRHAAELSADRIPQGLRIGVIGEATARAAVEAGLAITIVAQEARAEGLVRALKVAAGGSVAGLRFLLVRAARGREVLPNDLESDGAIVDVAQAYRTEGIPEGATRAAGLLSRGDVDLVVATSGGALEELASALSCKEDVLSSVKVAALGPVTADRARELGFQVLLVADTPSADGLVDGLVTWAKEKGKA